jgi:hypothetical protein
MKNMKKLVALLLVFVMVLALAACGKQETKDTSYADFMAADEGATVTVVTYVQACESWWDGKISVHVQSPEGALYIHEMACSEEDAAKLVPGTKISVTGTKAVWNGLIEIDKADEANLPTFEFVDGDPWIAEAADFAAIAAEGKLEEHMNEFFAVNGTVVAKDEEGAAFFCDWNNAGEVDKCDLYFDVDVNGTVYTFVARRYLTAPGSEVYEAVKNLKVGDTVDIQGFLYWYEGPQPHITSLIVK